MIEEFSDNPGAFAAAFFFAHDLFRVPGEEQWAFLVDENTQRIWSALASVLDLPEDIGLPEESEIFEREYLEAFETGAFPGEDDLEGGPGSAAVPVEGSTAVPLAESLYETRFSRQRILQENGLFHSAFGLRVQAGDDPADHLRRQLEFVGYLYKAESAAFDRDGSETDGEEEDASEAGIALAAGGVEKAGKPADPVRVVDRIRDARSEFLTRHLANWLPRAAEKAADFGVPWVRNCVDLAWKLVEAAKEESED
jgi:TorA maturation chaperone TorD